jgi:peptidyl-prolyl cis-trans isomerase A (cyclophilin A)
LRKALLYYFATTIMMKQYFLIGVNMFKKFLCTSILFLSFTSFVNATTVVFNTSEGEIEVNLFDQTTPKTVANFLQYIDEQHYTNSVIHRVSPGFIVQGGGFTFEGNWPLTRIETNPSVINEPIYSNVKGTIAMAKLGNAPNSATDQWFFNLSDNNTGSANQGNLDLQNGGFTVFGQITGDGMAILEKIAGLDLCQEIPMIEYSSQNCSAQTTPGIENFVVINQIDILDPSEVTDADLNPVKNTLIITPAPDSGSSSGGSFSWLTVLCLLSFSMRKLIIKAN